LPVFFRVVKSVPATERDFFSQRTLGRRLRHDTPENRWLWDGVSVTDTEEASRQLLLLYPILGAAIAVLDVVEDELIIWKKTTSDPHHYTLWGSPRDLLGAVVSYSGA
jgi:hypothetical protein